MQNTVQYCTYLCRVLVEYTVTVQHCTVPSSGHYISSSRPTSHQRVEDRCELLIRGKEDAAAEDRPPKPHRRPPPEPLDPLVGHDALERLHRRSAARTLRPSLDRVKRLGRQRRDNPGNGSVCKVGRRRLRNVARVLVVFEDVVGAHAERRSPGLLQRRPREAPVQAEEAGLGVYRADAVDCGLEALGVSGVVD